MALFKPITTPRGRSNQLQEVMCPRCKYLLIGEENSVPTTGEDGIARREVTGKYKCTCGYSIEVVETYPVINQVIQG